jgi:hypothetical protein
MVPKRGHGRGTRRLAATGSGQATLQRDAYELQRARQRSAASRGVSGGRAEGPCGWVNIQGGRSAQLNNLRAWARAVELWFRLALSPSPSSPPHTPKLSLLAPLFFLVWASIREGNEQHFCWCERLKLPA